jgi:hypothetical protein
MKEFELAFNMNIDEKELVEFMEQKKWIIKMVEEN